MATTARSRRAPHPNPPLLLNRTEARLIAVAAQGLDRRPSGRRAPAKTDLADLVGHVGCLQLDTISVISRSHETVAWSRLGPYDRRALAELHHPDGWLFEYWAHAAAQVPIGAFPYFRRTMARFADPDSELSTWLDANRATAAAVLAAIRDQGPLSSRAFERPDGPRPAAWSWWGDKPARRALDLLWTRGELMVVRRDGFERVFDLTERVVGDLVHQPLPSIEEQRRHFVGTALRALGVATPQWVADYFRTGGRPHVPPGEAAAELALLSAEGAAVPVAVDGLDGPAWLDADQLPLLEELRAGRRKPTLTTLLSPFDNLIWHRGRTAALFGFAYRLESYTPAPRRTYGYYTLPILRRGSLVGRLDPSYDRKARLLAVKTIHLERGIRPTPPLLADVAAALRDLGAFLGATTVAVQSAHPDGYAADLQAALERGERAADHPR